MTIEKAVNNYHGAKGYNCAQSILAAFDKRFDVTDEMIQEYRSCGGGRAPKGVCGALYAACQLIAKENPDLKEQFHNHFQKLTGSDKCREIRKNKRKRSANLHIISANPSVVR